jgi:hypothetical protein
MGTVINKIMRDTVGPTLGLVLCCLILGLCPHKSMAQVLPGDAIIGYRVVGVEKASDRYWDWEMKLEVWYTYNPAHKEVGVGAQLLPAGPDLESGFGSWSPKSGSQRSVQETREGNIIRGLQRVEVAVRVLWSQAHTNRLRLYLYKPGGREFLSATYAETRVWVNWKNPHTRHIF